MRSTLPNAGHGDSGDVLAGRLSRYDRA